jgi:hypothetical protein
MRRCLVRMLPAQTQPIPEALHRKQVVLVSTPWPLFNRPSIQLRALKAYLTPSIPDWRFRPIIFTSSWLPPSATVFIRTFRSAPGWRKASPLRCCIRSGRQRSNLFSENHCRSAARLSPHDGGKEAHVRRISTVLKSGGLRRGTTMNKRVPDEPLDSLLKRITPAPSWIEAESRSHAPWR